MTSYILMKLCDKWYPLKVGGKTKGEPMLDPKIARKMKRAELQLKKEETIEEGLEQISKLKEDLKINKSIIEDIQTAYIAWTTKDSVGCVPDNMKSITVLGPNKKPMPVKVKSITKWSRGTKAIRFDGQPFYNLSYEDVDAMNNYALMSFIPGSIDVEGQKVSMTLARTERKTVSKSGRAVKPSGPSFLGMSKELTKAAPERKRGRAKEEPIRVTDDLGYVWVWIGPRDQAPFCFNRKTDFREICKGFKYDKQGKPVVDEEGNPVGYPIKGHYRLVGKIEK